MNECLFLVQTALIIGFALGALRLGKEALVAWVAIQALIANLFVLKQITLFGLHVTASDAFAIGSLLGLNFLQEYYSRDEANKATWICFFFLCFFCLVAQVHLLYQPSPHDTVHSSYVALLSPSPRLLIASLAVFFAIQQFDIRFFALLKKMLPHTGFAYRTTIALAISQFLDTVLFSFAGLYGFAAAVFDIIIMSYLVKLIVIFCFTTIIKWVRT